MVLEICLGAGLLVGQELPRSWPCKLAWVVSLVGCLGVCLGSGLGVGLGGGLGVGGELGGCFRGCLRGGLGVAW